MPYEWVWRTRPLTYTVNSQGYRAPEWKNIKWNDSILVFGCSFVFGLGIDDNDTCSHKIYETTFVRTVNLGLCGASPMATWINSTILRREQISPRAVLYVWPFHHRTAELLPDTKCKHYGGNAKPTSFNYQWSTHLTHGLEYLRYCVYNTNLIWNCPVFHYHLDKDVCDLIPEMKFLDRYDRARDINDDFSHPGFVTNATWADIMVEDLEKAGVA